MLLYDGSFEGYLSAVFDVYAYQFADAQITAVAGSGSLFNPVHQVTTVPAHSERVLQGLKKKISGAALQQLWYCFLTEDIDMEKMMLTYIRYAFSSGRRIEKDAGHPAVLYVQQMAKKAGREKHRMEAFIRFIKGADGIFFSVVAPDFNVLPLISDHFQKRYADQQWLIFDKKRQYGIFYDLQEVVQVEMGEQLQINPYHLDQQVLAEEEQQYQALWKNYFQSVNIQARKNTKLHKKHMPARYWKYLVEKIPGAGA